MDMDRETNQKRCIGCHYSYALNSNLETLAVWIMQASLFSSVHTTTGYTVMLCLIQYVGAPDCVLNFCYISSGIINTE